MGAVDPDQVCELADSKRLVVIRDHVFNRLLDVGCPVFSDWPDRGRAPILICGPVWLGLLIPDDNREKTEELGRPEELVCKRLAAGVKNFRDAV